MYLRQLELRDFRNYERLSLPQEAGLVVFHGPNGAGKSNLLEAICVATSGQSPRTRATEELVRAGCDHGFLSGAFAGREGEVSLEVGLARAGPRQIKINGVVKRWSDLIGLAPVVYFSAEDMAAVKGDPGARRQLLDRDLSAVSRSYYFHLFRYRKALHQRNRLLKELRAGRGRPEELGPWDRAAARYGARLMLERSQFIAQLAPECRAAHIQLSRGERPFVIEYRPSVALPNGQNAAADGKEATELVEDIASALAAALQEERGTDIARGTTGSGPHRDDLALLLAGRPARVFGSQGEQRSCAVAMRLGLAAVVHRATEERPLLLLDDVLSELDARYRAGVFAASRGAEQIIITCCDIEDIPAEVRESGAVFEVGDGCIR